MDIFKMSKNGKWKKVLKKAQIYEGSDHNGVFYKKNNYDFVTVIFFVKLLEFFSILIV